MSQRQFMIVLAHAHICGMCRARLLAEPTALLATHSLSEEERRILTELQFEHFITPDGLARAAQVARADLDFYAAEPVVRLRHL